MHEVLRVGIEPGTHGLEVQNPNHSATLPPWRSFLPHAQVMSLVDSPIYFVYFYFSCSTVVSILLWLTEMQRLSLRVCVLLSGFVAFMHHLLTNTLVRSTVLSSIQLVVLGRYMVCKWGCFCHANRKSHGLTNYKAVFPSIMQGCSNCINKVWKKSFFNYFSLGKVVADFFEQICRCFSLVFGAWWKHW